MRGCVLGGQCTAYEIKGICMGKSTTPGVSQCKTYPLPLRAIGDFRVIAENAYIHFVHAKMAVTPGWGGGTRLTRIVGRRAALQYVQGA